MTAETAATTAATTDGAPIDEAMIERLVDTFYARAREDDLLGPVFNAHVGDWDAHLAKIAAFWSSVMLRTRRYQGRPVPAHVKLGVDARHFDRWLELFAETARETCPVPAAEQFIARARMIATSLELAMATHDGVLLQPGERYVRKPPPGGA